MPTKNSVRGKVLEREVVQLFRQNGIVSKRAWGSNGESLGLHATVDVVAGFNNELRIQCKRKKSLPLWLGFTKHVNAVVVREDRGRTYILLDLEEFVNNYLRQEPEDNNEENKTSI